MSAIANQSLPTDQSLLSGINVLLEGPTGTGKTHALGTFADAVTNAGGEFFGLWTESGIETFLGYWTDKGRDIPAGVHWHVLPRGVTPGTAGSAFTTLAHSAQLIGSMTQESLHKMQDPNRGTYHTHFHKMLSALADFPDDRTGVKFGAVDSWGPNRCLAVDSLTGINPIALSLVVGGKPVKSQSDWGIAQDQIEKLVRQLTDGCKCHVVLLSHVEREVDQVFGGVKITVATLGKALAPKLPPMFSDVILTQRDGVKFSWSTANSQADLKARNLPIAEGIPPDFKPLLDKWQSRGGRFSATVKT